MIVIQNCDGYECHGKIVAKGRTIENAYENFKKNCDWFFDPVENEREEYNVKNDGEYIWVHGRRSYRFTEI